MASVLPAGPAYLSFQHPKLMAQCQDLEEPSITSTADDQHLQESDKRVDE
jgi:hypothetical protein